MKPEQEGRFGGTDSRDGAQAGRAGLRGPRSMVFAVVCVYAALGLHTLAGGSGVGPGLLAAATAATGAGAFLLARRRRSLGTLVVAAFAAQYGMHRLFGMGGTAPASSHHEHGHGGGELSTGLGMLVAHVVVAALSAWWLHRGETALGMFLTLLARAVRGFWRGLTARAPLPETGVTRPVVPAAVAVRQPQVLTGAMCRRGPPVR
ncbi:MFS transporter [Nonomuraea wenchangensis]|uniref:MFS transporter n=1 Tax=Nonomuraea wenchangensis TaxID=568860 RepID=UPI0037183702